MDHLQSLEDITSAGLDVVAIVSSCLAYAFCFLLYFQGHL